MIRHSITTASCLTSTSADSHPFVFLPWPACTPAPSPQSSPHPQPPPSKKLKLAIERSASSPSSVSLSDAQRQEILQECCDSVTSQQKLNEFCSELSPEFAAVLSPTDRLLGDNLTRDLVRYQLQIIDYIATFNSRFSSVVPLASPELLSKLVEYMATQVQRLLQDNVNRIQQCRSQWANENFLDLCGVKQSPAIMPTSIFSSMSAFRKFDGVSSSAQSSSVNSPTD